MIIQAPVIRLSASRKEEVQGTGDRHYIGCGSTVMISNGELKAVNHDISHQNHSVPCRERPLPFGRCGRSLDEAANVR